METKNDVALLFIEPKEKGLKNPMIDIPTKKITAALRRYIGKGVMTEDEFLPNFSTKGSHHCACGRGTSSTHDFVLPNGLVTNSLCIHYVAFHRDEISESEMQIVLALDCGTEYPSDAELSGHIWEEGYYHQKEAKL